MTDSPYMTVDEASAFLRCNRQRLYNLAAEGRLARYKEGSRLLFKRKDVEDLVQHAPV